MKQALLISFIALGLAACSTTGNGKGEFQRAGDVRNAEGVIVTPVSDLNLEQTEIPPMLSEMKTPYSAVGSSCADLRLEVAKLNNLLGDDLDVAEEDRNQTALNAASATVGSIIPFRGVVRAISGASKHEMKVRQAWEMGLTRRAYVKGVASQRGCTL